MVSTVDTVECAICFTTHLEVPPLRDGELEARDFTYYRDWYKGEYAVICKKTHDDLLAPKLAKLEN